MNKSKVLAIWPLRSYRRFRHLYHKRFVSIDNNSENFKITIIENHVDACKYYSYNVNYNIFLCNLSLWLLERWFESYTSLCRGVDQ